MKIVVLVKKTPDTESKISIAAGEKSLDQSATKFIINPYDEYAIEQALQLKDQGIATEVIIVSVGDESTKEIIVKALAMGADRGVLVTGVPEGSFAVAAAIAKVVEAEKPEIVWAGRHGIDDNNMHVALMVAELLDLPHVNIVSKFEIAGKQAKVERPVEGGQIEVYDVGLPAVFGADKALNQPRYASLPNIMKAKKKPIDLKSWDEIGGASYGLPADFLPTKFSYPPEKKAGEKMSGLPAAEMVDKLILKLREEAKVL